MKLTKKLQAEILKIYNTYWDAYLAGDMKTFASMLDDNIKVFGTAVSEVFNNKAETIRFYKATADQMTGKAEFRNRKIKMNPVEETVLIHEQSNLFVLIENEWIFYSPVRVSAIFVNTPKGWKLTHQHGSFPDSRAEAGEQIAPEKIRKENLELREAIKRRTVELENINRELEIEASLEKVRTIAMGMRKPDDMLDVCKTISLQLQSLGVKEIRNVQTAIIYASKSIYINYEYYAKHKKQFITEVDFKSHYYQKLFVNKMLKGTGEIFTKTIKGKKVKEWYEHQKTTNQFADRYLGKAKSLSYYWFSLGPLALGISTYSPLSEEELNLFKRFRNVFELAYQRYLDIEKAETQAREAQIEASLERVRAVAMGMNKSDDLLSICEVSFKEFKRLGFDNIRNALIHIQYDNQKYFMDYDFSDLTGGAITKIEYGSHPVVEDYLKQIRSSKDAFYQGVIKEDQLEEWKNFRRNSGQIDDPRLDKATALYYYFFSIGIGDIGISTLEPINESQIKILKRFRNVFDLAYRRYTDITRAEAQAKEARIEAALEKVRSRSLAMHKSDDIKDVVVTVMEKMNELKIEMNGGVSLATFVPNSNDLIHWYVNPNHVDGPVTMHLPYFDNVLFHDFIEARKSGKEILSVVYSFEQKNKYFEHRFEHSDFKNIPEDLKKWIFEQPYFGYSVAIQKHSAIFFNDYTGKLFSEKENEVLIRFAKVFDQAYIRFLDLQKAEAQAKEAKIEAALERLRAKSMSMQKSDELHEVLAVLFEQFDILEIRPMSTHMTILDIENNKFTFRETGKFGNRSFGEHTFDLDAMDTWKDMVESWRNSEPFTINRLHFSKEKLPQVWEVFHKSFASMPEESRITPNDYPNGIYHTAGKHAFGYIGMNQIRPATAEEEQIVIKFASEFGRAYQRFLDLQKAEAQTREAQIQLALERVRARTMAMQNSNELPEAANLLFQQVQSLGMPAWSAGYCTWNDDEKKSVTLWMSSEGVLQPPFTAPTTKDELFIQMRKGCEEGKTLHVVEMGGRPLVKHYQYMRTLTVVGEILDSIIEAGHPLPTFQIMHQAYFSKGFLLFITYKKVPEVHDIFKRFANVFDQTYTRFLDLQRAEAQNKIIQSENDRKTKELEDARQLQLAMLPRELPKIPHLDITVYMKTATEVGGDYYDFNVDANGTLTVLVGDATGHGMMSGMMVSIMKSFFISNKANIELKQFFENSNNSIKDMQLGRLMMGLIGIQITTEKIIATNAGMPSLLYFRNKSQKAGEFVSNNLPLGGMKGTQYLLKEINYEKGDTLLLMSDGFAELKNSQNEQYGYVRIKEIFRSLVQKSSSGIIEELKTAASQWTNGAEPDDDITFVVIKVK